MAYEVITLNLIPSGEVPVIHAAQFDVNRPLMFALKLGADDFDPSTYDLELQIRKVDNNIVTAAPASTSGNVVTFNSTEQMTACSGTNLGEIQITKGDLDIATLHFYLVVQRDVLAGGITSESEIHNLTSQIEEIAEEVIGENYYTKTETDELLSDKADAASLAPVALSGSYDDLTDKPDIPDVSDYYDKEEIDTLLTNKADVSDLPDMTQYYTKSETDTLLSTKADKTVVDAIKLLPTIKSVSGSIVTFETDLAENLVNCLFDTLATKLVNISGNVTDLAAYIRGIYQGNYGFTKIDDCILNRTTSYDNPVFYGSISGLKPQTSNIIIASPFNVISGKPSASAFSSASNDYDFAINSANTGDNIQVFLRCDIYNDVPSLKSAYGDVYIIYELSTPTTPTITQTDLTNICTSFGVSGVVIDLPTTEYPNTFNGNNNVFTDNNDITVKYLESIGKAISD